ncbi:MAG: branched-chain amino acid transport system substrate-binding protein [Acidobacteriota bacterium]|nr:branched-chain amino acid transport system substrate-binding protein [Acidobacteriota bacterium]
MVELLIHKIFKVVLVLCAVLSATGCRRQDARVVEKPPPERVRVGAFMSLSGDTAQYGISALNGIRMAVEEANAAGGVKGMRVDLVVRDTRSDAVETALVVERLAREEHVQGLLGEVVSSRSLAAARVAQREQVPVLTPSATSPEVTAVGDYVFRSCYTDTFQGVALARFSIESLGALRAALLVDRDQRYSVELARLIREDFERRGGKVVAVQEYPDGESDFSVQLAEVGAAQPDVIFIPGYYMEVGLLARQARALGLNVPLVGGDGWDSPRLAQIGGQALTGGFFTTHFSAEDPDPQVQRFVADYRRLFGTPPDSFSATAYDAARIMLNAIERAPTLERAAVRDSLAATKDFPGVTGTVTFNAERNAVKPIVVVRIGDNGRQTVEAHVTPEDVAPPATPTPSPTPKRGRPRRGK